MLPVSGNTTIECSQRCRCSTECHHTLKHASFFLFFFCLALIMHALLGCARVAMHTEVFFGHLLTSPDGFELTEPNSLQRAGMQMPFHADLPSKTQLDLLHKSTTQILLWIGDGAGKEWVSGSH